MRKQLIKVNQSLRAVEEHDKESFKMNLNYILCCRPWDILPDILDKFEIINEGKDLSHYMKKMLGKRIGEAFMPLRESVVFLI